MCFVVESEVKSLQSTFEHVRTKMYCKITDRKSCTEWDIHGIQEVSEK